MARRQTRVTIKAEPTLDEDGRVIAPAQPGRDEGKTYVLTEMSAKQAESWGGRALTALTHSGAELPDEIMTAGMAGFAMMGMQALAGIKFEEIEPLMNEMFECVRIAPDPKNPDLVRDLVEDDIEEVWTRVKLRIAVLDLHVRPSTPVAP